ncbi:MAG: hypothetical protein VX893_05200 [Candidatus Latescibacterota bacterium]|nr:hypothetical protein [Candidatus Latescibacterota bacterium]
MLQIFDTLARFVARGYKSLNFLQYAQIGLEVIDRGQRAVSRNDFILGVDCLQHGFYRFDNPCHAAVAVAVDKGERWLKKVSRMCTTLEPVQEDQRVAVSVRVRAMRDVHFFTIEADGQRLVKGDCWQAVAGAPGVDLLARRVRTLLWAMISVFLMLNSFARSPFPRGNDMPSG